MRQRDFAHLRTSVKTPTKSPNNNFNKTTVINHKLNNLSPDRFSITPTKRQYNHIHKSPSKQDKVTAAKPLINTNFSPNKNYANKIQDVCIGCANKILSEHKRKKDLNTKEIRIQTSVKQTKAQTQKKQEIAKLMIKNQQKSNLMQIEEKQRNRLFQQQQKKYQIKKIKAEIEDIIQQQGLKNRIEQEKKLKLKNQLKEQLLQNQRKKVSQKYRNRTPEILQPYFGNRQQQQQKKEAVNKNRKNKEAILEQIKQNEEKKLRQKLLKNNRNEMNTLNIIDSQPIKPNIYYEAIRNQIEQKNINRKNQINFNRTQQIQNVKKQWELEVQNRNQQQRLKNIKKQNYLQELTKQMKVNDAKRKQQDRDRKSPGFTNVSPRIQERKLLKNCKNCAGKYPSNHLSNLVLQ